MKNPFARFFRKEVPEDWRLVHTHESTWKRTEGQNIVKSGTVYFHLFESDKGTRYAQIIAAEVPVWITQERITPQSYPEVLARLREEKINRSSFLNRHDLDVCEFVLTNEHWNEILYPWLCGRTDPKIPTYGEIPKREFAEALAGKKV